ncbi:MAG: RIP metalloprotease RseP [Gammaproteobacteria bacterium]
MTALVSLVAFLVAVAILVTFHEFGHFVVARLLGVKVLRFSLGFGRPLLRWRRGEGTEYVISAIPLGGYVKMLDEREGEVPVAERAQAFNRQPIWRRAAILVAGPGFNILFALIVYWTVFMIGIPGIKPILGPVAPNTPAERAGLNEHAAIRAVNDQPTPTWQAARLAMLNGVVLGEPLKLKLAAPDGGITTHRLYYTDIKALTQPDGLLPGLGLSIWLPPHPAVLGEIEPDSAAERAGLQSGDRVLAVNDKPVAHWSELVKNIQDSPGQRLVLRIERDGRRFEIPVVPEVRETNGRRIGHIGAAAHLPKGYAESLRALRAEYHLAPLPAFMRGAGRTGEMTAMTVAILYRMVSGEASLSNLSGPVGIAQAAGALAEAGIVPYLLFLALISISLGILNLLPIPILDGGQLLYLVIEAVRRRPLSEYAEAIGQRVGLSLIAILFGFAVFNDFARILHS